MKCFLCYDLALSTIHIRVGPATSKLAWHVLFGGDEIRTHESLIVCRVH